MVLVCIPLALFGKVSRNESCGCELDLSHIWLASISRRMRPRSTSPRFQVHSYLEFD